MDVDNDGQPEQVVWVSQDDQDRDQFKHWQYADGDATVHRKAEVIYKDRFTGVAADASFDNVEAGILDDGYFEEDIIVTITEGEELNLNEGAGLNTLPAKR